MKSVWRASQRIKSQLDAIPSWTAVLLAASLIATCGAVVWRIQSNPSDAQQTCWLLEGRRFSENQLGEIIQAFAKANLTEYAIIEHRVQVPPRRVHDYLAALAVADALPQDLQSHTVEALRRSNPFESRYDRQLRLRHARAQDLAVAIRSMQGVDDAMVQFDQIEQHGFRNQRISTASVAVLPTAGHILDQSQIRAIRHLVAAAHGVAPDDVTVTDLRSAQSYTRGSEDEAIIPRAEQILSIKRSVERDWKAKVLQALQFVPDVQIAVDVELTGEGDEANSKISIEPQRLAILVGCPESYLIDVWRTHSGVINGRPTTEQLAKQRQDTENEIRDVLLALIPDHIDMASAVTVTTFRDVSRNRTPLWPAEVQRSLELIFENRLALTSFMVIGTVVFVLSAVRRRRAGPLTADTIPMSVYEPNEGDGGRVAVNARDPNVDEQTLRATLAEMVREDPDGAADILHRWIDKAG